MLTIRPQNSSEFQKQNTSWGIKPSGIRMVE
jgi:hypothetical protein